MKLPVYRVRRPKKPLPPLKGLTADNFAGSERVSLNETVTGQPALLRSEAGLLWDSRGLYAFFSFEDPQPFATLRKHDAPLYTEDVAELFIDPLGTGNAYFELEVNPLNAGFDAFIVNSIHKPGRRGKFFQGLLSWNPKSFRHKVVKEKDGWSVFLSIGFEDLFLAPPGAPRPGDRWRGNMFRIDVANKKQSYFAWSPTHVVDFHNSKRFGSWVFI